jgi:hypothetical protein
VRVFVVLVLDPPGGDHSEDCDGVRQRRDADLFALQRLHERVCDAIVTLRALHQPAAGLQAELAGDDVRDAGDMTGAIVAQYLDRMRCPLHPKPLLDGLQHYVSSVQSTNAGINDQLPGDDLAVVPVDVEGATLPGISAHGTDQGD